jgi:hypothetical protein
MSAATNGSWAPDGAYSRCITPIIELGSVLGRLAVEAMT